jgi:hypothetical protein
MERRRRRGLDRLDEVWAGVLHVNPAPHGRHAALVAQLIVILAPLARAAGFELLAASNVGEPDDFRVPGACVQGAAPARLYYRPRRWSSR